MRNVLFGLMLLAFMLGCTEREEMWEADRHFEQGNYKAAVEQYSRFLALNPTHLKALYNRGRAYEELGDVEKALADFQSVIEENPNHVQANISIAMDYYFRKQDYALSIKYLNEALTGGKKSAKAYTLRGKCFQKLGNLERANRDYSNAISTDDEYADAYFSRASLRILQRNSKEACADFQLAANLGLEEAVDALKKYCK